MHVCAHMNIHYATCAKGCVGTHAHLYVCTHTHTHTHTHTRDRMDACFHAHMLGPCDVGGYMCSHKRCAHVFFLPYHGSSVVCDVNGEEAVLTCRVPEMNRERPPPLTHLSLPNIR